MEKDSPSKPSVAELAGRLKGHILPMTTTNNGLSFQRKSPCSTKNPKFQTQRDDNEESDKAKPFKIKLKNSPIIEKLQANLALSPTALLPAPKTPEVQLQPAPLSASTSCRPASPTPQPPPPPPPTEEEEAAIFNSPPESTPLPSVNKTRARLSFKRRPPSRRHRRSAGDEDHASALALTPCELLQPTENGEGEPVLGGPAEEAGALEAGEKDRNCAQTQEEEDAEADRDSRRDLEEEREQEQAQNLTPIEEEQVSGPSPSKEIGGVENRQQEMVEEERPADNSQM